MWWQIGMSIFHLLFIILWHHCLLILQSCQHVDSDLTADWPQDAKGHQTCDRCLYPKLPPGRSRSCSAPATPATPYGEQGETTRHGPGGYTRVVKLQHSATEHYIQTPAFLLFYLCTCTCKLLQIYLEIYGKLFIAWLLLRPNICLMAVTIFLSRYSLFWCYIQLLVPSAEKIIKYPLGHLVKTLNTGSWKCHITS